MEHTCTITDNLLWYKYVPYLFVDFVMTKPLDARIQKSQAAILEAGLELLGNNSEATLSDIAQQAGVGRTTLYRLYETKEQLTKAIAIHCLGVFEQATEHLEADAKSALHAFHLMFKAILPLSAELEFLLKLGDIAEDDPELVAIFKKQQQGMIELVEYAKKEGSISKQIPTVWIVNLVEGLFYSSWLTMNENIMSNEALAGLAFETLCNGIKR